ncbi:MAG TPA: malto-oligosyltrehalose synthase [Gemmatimonadaceae bacterium]|nr:malto-oligosyltrehalose synthase [Gemmatimonadaceae bacterium]
MPGEGRGTRPTITATCRLQLHKEFTLGSVREIVPYLHRLGVSHVYSSPILMARPGSEHGYDVVDPTRLNPELGTDDEWRALIDELHARGMGWVLDIVPNHMGTGSANPFWEDVLARGRGSPYASWFDIEWEARASSPAGTPTDDDTGDRVLLPVLGDELRRVIDRREIVVAAEGGRHRVRYFENSFPVGPGTIDEDTLRRAELEGGDALERVVNAQHYRLTFWRRGAREINYRRFFDINDLVAMRQEDPAVFDATHAKILGWVRAGVVDALRIDHVDGLLDPLGYLERLRSAVGDGVPIFVEKILSPGEHLRREWPVQGTTGYEFLNDLEGIFIEPSGYDRIERAYRSILGVGDRLFDFHHIALSGKLRILTSALESDVRRLTRLLRDVLSSSTEAQPALEPRDLALAVVELLATLPVYRTYIDDRSPVAGESDRAIIDAAMQGAMHRREAPPAALSVLGAILRQGVGGAHDQADRERRMRFIGRFQQTSGPATAKGVEDTALYRFVPLASRNEVGSDPERDLRDAVVTLHHANRLRASRWPSALVTTNTHDTKRSADVRARIDVLSEIPNEWERAVRRWRSRNGGARTKVGRRWVPDANTEYLIYETLAGVWPLDEGHEALADLRERAANYLEKASREAKTHTSWTAPDEPAERAVAAFLQAILKDDSPFVPEMGALARRIARPGFWNALARVAVHFTAPGTPDLYQGDEMWFFALVDPDNRRPVDWANRARQLSELDGEWSGEATRQALLASMMERPEDGRVKLHVTARLLSLRRERPSLFAAGGYEPLLAAGPSAHHLFAFARSSGGEHSLTVVPRLTLGLPGDPPTGARCWGATYLPLPPELAGARWQCALSGRIVHAGTLSGAPALPLEEVLNPLPVSVLTVLP